MNHYIKAIGIYCSIPLNIEFFIAAFIFAHLFQNILALLESPNRFLQSESLWKLRMFTALLDLCTFDPDIAEAIASNSCPSKRRLKHLIRHFWIYSWRQSWTEWNWQKAKFRRLLQCYWCAQGEIHVRFGECSASSFALAALSPEAGESFMDSLKIECFSWDCFCW